MTEIIRDISLLTAREEIGREIKTVFFDYGGTLDTGGRHWMEVIGEAYRHAGIEIDGATFRDAYVYAERALEKSQIILPSDNFHEVMLKKLALQRDFLRMDFDIRPIAEYCYKTAQRFTGEAVRTLRILAERVPLVLVSNFYGNLESVTADFGIRDFFTLLIDSTIVGIRKPDSRIFALAHKEITGKTGIEIHPAEVLVIGDSIKNDIAPALSLGFKAIRLSDS